MPELFPSFPSFLVKKHYMDFSAPVEPQSLKKDT